MFLKKSLLFTTALALLMFAGQASAQLSLSLGEGGSATVTGAGTEIAVDVSQMGVDQSVNAIQVVFEIGSAVTLTGAPAGFLITGGNTASLLSITPVAVPASASFTFTTASDVTGVEFSIGVSSISLNGNALPVPAPAALMFNAGGTPPPDGNGDNGGDNGDTGMTPDYDNLSVALTRVGEGPVNAGDNVVVNVAVDGLEAEVTGGEITLTVDPPVAAITDGAPAGGLSPIAMDASSITVIGVPTTLEGGSYGTLTLTLGPAYDGSMVSISASVTVFTAGGMKVAAAAGDPVTVTGFSPFLEASATAVEIPHGETATATVTAMDTQGEAVAFTVDPEGAGTVSDDGNSVTVSATGNATVTVSATAGGVDLDPVTIVFTKAPPVLMTESAEVVFEDFGASASASVTAAGFDEGAEIRFTYTASTDFEAMEDGSGLTITTASAGTVTVTATDGTAEASLTITFSNPDPYLTASETDVIIPEGGEYSVTISATGLEGVISYMISRTSGAATVNADTDGGMVTLTASGEGSAMVSVTGTGADGTSTETVDILFREMPSVGSDATDVVVIPQATVPSAMAMVVATGFPEGAEITFNVDPSDSPYLTTSADGNVLTLTSTGTVTVSVTASGAGITTSAVEVTFEQELPAAPASVVVQDQEGDNGHYVMVSFANSSNHADVSQYRVYREMMVNTAMDADGNVVVVDEPVAKWVPWAVVDAMDNDDEEGMTRAVVPVTDDTATRWGVAAEKGMDSAEITPAGKRVFSKESVQLMAQLLGVDPNRIVTEDELAKMFMPSADYINSIIGGRKNVVFAALDPDLSVLVGGDVAVPQNIRTDGSGPIVSSPITPTGDMVGAVDDTAPAAATDLAADVETGIVTWTASADDGGLDMVMYRGHAIIIPHVLGYRIMGGASQDAMIDIGVVPAGSTSFQVPQALIESLINQGVPAVLLTVVAMDGTNMTPSVPLVVELIPTRKAFVDADGGSVYVVKLDRHGAMTPLTVDFEDFVAFTMAFNTDETHENWRVFVQADLNDDKMVNFDDFILFFSSYGKEAQGPAGKSLVTPVLGVNENAEFSLRLGSDRVVAGEMMFVDVSLANVQALMGYGFVLHFDTEKFEFVEAVPAAEDLLKSAGGETPLFRSLSPEAGQVHVMNAIFNGSEVSGDGDIVRLIFRVLSDFEDNARFEIADGLVFDPSQFANPLAGGVLDIQTTPTEFALLQNFPNPFNPDTTIGYELAESADVTLQIYNVVGQVVRTLMAAESQSVGRYQVRWDGMDDRGMPVSSGIYFYQISAGKFQDVRKLMLLK